jgi:hypothetical protein
MSETPYPWIEFSLTIGTWDVADLAYLHTRRLDISPGGEKARPSAGAG